MPLTRRGPLRAGLPVLALLWAGAPAQAQQILVTGTLGATAESASPATKLGESAILPTGRLEVGGELVFLTADEDLAGETLRFSDVALLPLHARMAVTSWLELGLGGQLLAKQAEHMDEPVLQGGSAGLRVPFGSAFAGSVSGALGPLMNDLGKWWQVESALLTKLSAQDWLRFELRAGHAWTLLDYSGPASQAWLQEIMSHAEVQFGKTHGGAWIGVDYYVPFDSSNLDPNVRLNLTLGAVLSPRNTGWDLYASYTVVDRGAVDEPGSTLPIIDGGFDQRRWVLGVQHHFDLSKKERKHGQVLRPY